MKLFFSIPVSLLLTGICFCQNKSIIAAEKLINQSEVDSAYYKLNSLDIEKLTTYETAKFFEISAIINSNKDKNDIAFKEYIKAKGIYSSIDSLAQVANINLHIIDLLLRQENNIVSPQSYINDYIKYSEKSNNPLDKSQAYSTLATTYYNNKKFNESMVNFDLAMKFALKANDSVLATDFLFNKGVVHNNIGKKQNLNLALKIFNDIIPFYQRNGDITYVAYGYNNQAEAFKKLGNYRKAIEYYKKADSIQLQKDNLTSKKVFYENLIDTYKKLKDYKNAHLYSEKLLAINDSIGLIQQNISISEIQEKYDNEKLRADNLESEADAKLKQNIAIGLGGSLALGSIIAFLIFKNTKRKQKLAEQEKEIETQKLTTVLKEQELNAIDAMIEGQEKERQRIANDLHDDLGGLMTTVKWHFNALKEKDSPELYDKTNMLLDEAYQKIRSVAHAKNSGVIAKQGLLKAVKEMANKVSVANTLEIEVIDHGLENRLENSLELTIFRIIQELIANTIKHAQADEVTIHITNHDDSLNIMVEDNGIGFNANQITKTKKGMGISSIDKRVEHLDGKMTIESEKNKGTTIIIDIPL